MTRADARKIDKNGSKISFKMRENCVVFKNTFSVFILLKFLRVVDWEGGVGRVAPNTPPSGYASGVQLFMRHPSQSYGTPPAMWDHTVLPATRHK